MHRCTRFDPRGPSFFVFAPFVLVGVMATSSLSHSTPTPVEAEHGSTLAIGTERLFDEDGSDDDTEGTEISATAAEVEATAVALVDAFQIQVRRALPLARWTRSDWGVLVTSLDRGDTLFAHNAHQPLAPASNVKLLTTAAALHHLGEDYRFRTFLLSNAAVEDGVLDGDLTLYGTGDPTIAERVPGAGDGPLRDMAKALKERGIHTIAGDIVGDGTYFQGPSRSDDWGTGNLNEWFATPVDGLQFNENLVTLRIRPAAMTGVPAVVETIPEGAPVPLRVAARTVTQRTSHPVWALRDALDDPVSITGQIRIRDADVWRRIPVARPSLYAATGLRAALEAEGIRVSGGVRSVDDREGSVLVGGAVWAPGISGRRPPEILAEHRSEPLVTLLRVVNRESNNLYAESIIRALGRIVDGESSFSGGAEVVRRYAIEAGVPPEEVRPVDGSGLSPENRVSPFAFVRLLDHMAATPQWDAFWGTLPRAGNWQELRRMYRTPAASNLRAKTGTLRTASALSGVVTAENGERLAFSILSNEVPSTSQAKAIEDRIGVQLASFWRPGVLPTPRSIAGSGSVPSPDGSVSLSASLEE